MKKRKKLLLVDDDPEVSWGLGRFLTRHGWSVVTCGDGFEAIQLLEIESYNALVTDVQMPQLNGLALLEWSKRNRPELPVIVITAFGSASVRKVCLQKGAFHYLEKPVDPGIIAELLSVLDERDSFSGTVTCVDLFDYIQMMLVSRKKAIVVVQSVDGESGRLFIEGGNIVHAECAGTTGERAFIHCISFSGGSFTSLPWSEPEARSIGKRGDFLLMDAAREKDETGRIDFEEQIAKASQTANPSVIPDDLDIVFNIRNSIFPEIPDKKKSPEK